MRDKHARWRTDVIMLGLLAALTLAFFWKIALTNRVLAGLDVFAYFYPYRDYASEALRAGRLPLWNPYLFMGAPLLANSQAAVLYPLHWPLIWLAVPKQVAWSIVLHVWLAGAGTYLFARRAVRLQPLAALVAASTFALGGFLGAQVEHVNQLNASAWLPWLLLCVEGATGGGRRRGLALLGGGAVVGLTLLAGHTQAAYIVLAGAALYALARRASLKLALRGVASLAAMVSGGLLLAAGQLLPTLELSRLSVRSGGLPYNEAASFSLKPGLIFKAFLPPLVWEPPFSEYVAYVGLIGLSLAAVGAWAVIRRKRAGWPFVILAGIGVFLAFGAYNPVYYVLYKLVPGFDLFRAPARWLLLYGFGAAVLAGLGLEVAIRHRIPPHPSLRSPLPGGEREFTSPLGEGPGEGESCSHPTSSPSPQTSRPGKRKRTPLSAEGSRRGKVTSILTILLLIELFLAGRKLAYNRPTAPAAFDSMRSAPAHLLADQAFETENEIQPFRFLSMSGLGYDPGDMGDLQAMYAPQLPDEAIYDLIVATKMKEVLAYNLPLRYGIYSVDGYDGGLLPIARYVTLERLFLDEEDIWSDGRLSQQLARVPPARLLSLLNVKYVITDKLQDVWIDDVFYDLEHTLPLGQVTLTDLPDFESIHLGVVSYLTDTLDLPDGAPVARLTVTGMEGSVITDTLRAGVHTAEGRYMGRPVAHQQAQIGHVWQDDATGQDYIAMLDLGQSLRPARIHVESLLPGKRFHLRGLSLIDEETGTSRTLSVHPAYRQVHSGDVKIYRNREVLPRAFAVHRARVEPDDEAALALLSEPAFDPAEEVVLASGTERGGGASQAEVKIVAYAPERVQIQANLTAPGYLVLTDSHYPGWVAEVDGRPAPILQADLYFRAVALDAGEHRVVFHYQPTSTYVGLAVSGLSLLTWAVALAILGRRIGRKSTSGV